MHPIFKPVHNRDLFWPICGLYLALMFSVPLSWVFDTSTAANGPLIVLGSLHLVSLYVIPANAEGPVEGFARALGLSFFALIGSVIAAAVAMPSGSDTRSCGMGGLIVVMIPAASLFAHFAYGILVATGLWVLEGWSNRSGPR